jgi:hypothetical protein
VASARLHPKWHPEVAHGTQRKALFRREFPRFFGEQHGERELLSNLGTRRQRLQDLLARCSDHWRYEDPVYRFYHQSFKVYSLQETTQAIIAELRGLVPGRPLHHSFARIAADGTGRTFTPADNQHWLETTRPIVEAFFHARFFLEMAVRYAHIDAPPSPLPSGYAALLRLFDLR